MSVSPQINDAIDDVAPVTGAVLYGGYTNDASPLIEINLGDQATAGGTLTLSDNGVVLRTIQLTAADVARGTEAVQLSNLGQGWNLLSLTLADPQGATLSTTPGWALGVATAAPATPAITCATDAGASVANGGHAADGAITFTLTEAGLPPSPQGSPGHAPYGGPAVFGGDLLLYDGKTVIADVKLGYDGPIQVTPDHPLAPGQHTLTAVVVDRAGNASAASTPFVVDVAGTATGGQTAGVGEDLQASAAHFQVVGGAGDDTLTGWSGIDLLHGGAGADSITGGSGFNDINGNQGDDTIVGVSTVGDWLSGGQGSDSITAVGSHVHNLVFGNMGADTLVAGSGGDLLLGGQGDDLIQGGAGSDWISGDRGQNTLSGGGGADIFHASHTGVDLVTDFNAAEGDRVLVDPGVTYTVSQDGTDTVIALSTGGRMTLAGVDSATLSSGWLVQV